MGSTSSSASATPSFRSDVRLVATPFGPKFPLLPLMLKSNHPDFSAPCCCGLGSWRSIRAYHTSVLVDGRELTFSWSGIDSNLVEGSELPSHSSLIDPPEIFHLGYADMSLTDVSRQLQDFFLPGTYDLLRKNCNSFSDCAIFCLTGARLSQKYKALESVGVAAEKHVGLVSRLSQGGYRPNARADGFELHQVISQLEQCMARRRAAEHRAARRSRETWQLREFAQVTMVAAEAELKELLQPRRSANRPQGLDAPGPSKAASFNSRQALPKLARTLVEMGFPEQQARIAAERFSSVEAAVDWIIAQPLPVLGTAEFEARL